VEGGGEFRSTNEVLCPLDLLWLPAAASGGERRPARSLRSAGGQTQPPNTALPP
jgi:hypothetical protein